MSAPHALDLRGVVADLVNVGIFAVDASMKILLWNRFMADNSGMLADAVVGKDLFEAFPTLPRDWLTWKIRNVFLLGNYSFVSWRQRPYIFRFPHNRPVTGGIACMHQDCTLIPLVGESGKTEAVYITLVDATDASILQLETERNARLLKDAMVELEHLSANDSLTGVFNRRSLDRRLRDELSRYKRYGTPFSLLLFDLDHFKRVNDGFGHLGGDEVLRVVSRRVAAELRDTDVLGRYGGEEFMVILPNTTSEQAMTVAERIRARIATGNVPFGQDVIAPTISVGVTEASAEVGTYLELIQEADTALYAAKNAGRNCVRIHVPAMPPLARAG